MTNKFQLKVNLESTRQLLPPKEEKQQRFENSQAYKRARDCLYLGTKIGNQISKLYKNTIATDYVNRLYLQCLNIALAYNEAAVEQKLIYLGEAIKANTEAIIILRLSFDLNGVKREDYTASISLLVEISMQLKNWKLSIFDNNNLSRE